MRAAPRHSSFAGTPWPFWPGCSDCGIGFAATYETGAEIRSLWTGGNLSKNRSPCRRSCSHWRRRTWTMPTAKCVTWRRRCLRTSNGCSRFWSTRAYSRPTIPRNRPCGRRCSGGRSASATAAGTAKSPLLACSPSPRVAKGSSATYWTTSLMPYAAIVVRRLHLLCSRNGPDHLNCYANLTGPAEEALRAQRAKYPPSHALSSSHETHLETNFPDGAPPAAPAHCRAHTDARDLPPPRRLRGCAWRPYLLPDTRPRRTAVDCARRPRRIARLLPSVPAAAGPPSQADLHRRAGVGKIGEARRSVRLHRGKHGGGYRNRPARTQTGPHQPAGPLVWRRAGAGLCAQLSGQSHSLDSVQHLPQYQ